MRDNIHPVSTAVRPDLIGSLFEPEMRQVPRGGRFPRPSVIRPHALHQSDPVPQSELSVAQGSRAHGKAENSFAKPFSVPELPVSQPKKDSAVRVDPAQEHASRHGDGAYVQAAGSECLRAPFHGMLEIEEESDMLLPATLRPPELDLQVYWYRLKQLLGPGSGIELIQAHKLRLWVGRVGRGDKIFRHDDADCS